jgi:predicted acylesterase/phospholipase RssA
VVEDADDADPADPCRAVPFHRTAGDLNLLEAAVFASGSPFPIFPAYRIGFERGAEKEALIDGGYTNLVPIDAATDVGAEQVLIVNSSHPLPASEPVGRLDLLTGPLVDNFLRLPGFLYERAQQIDRRSRAGLFVVSLSPAPQDDWPLVTDVRSEVVERMWSEAEKDFDERIGMVESWGPPRFQLSLRVEGRRPPARPADPPAPAAAPSR